MARNKAIEKPNAAKAKRKWDFSRNWQLYIMVTPPMIFLLVFCYIPMGGIVLAFKDYSIRKGILASPWVGFEHFENFLSSPLFGTLLSNTLILSIYTFIVNFIVPIFLALFINELAQPIFKKAVQMITFFPYLISVVVISGMILQFLNLNGGLVNNIIRLFGGTPVDFMAKPEYFRHIYVWTDVWQRAGYSAVIYIAALAGIDPQLSESAILDGVTRLKRIRYIDLPTVAPTVTIMLLMGIGGIMSIGYEKTYLLQNNLNMSVSELISTYIYKRGLLNFEFSYSTAIGLFNSVINLVLLISANAISKRVSETSLW